MSTPLRERLLARTLLISPKDPAARELYKIFPTSALPVTSFGEDFPSSTTAELRHVAGTGATGAWAGLSQKLIVRNALGALTNWDSYDPEEGWSVVASGIAWVYRVALGTWQVLAGGGGGAAGAQGATGPAGATGVGTELFTYYFGR